MLKPSIVHLIGLGRMGQRHLSAMLSLNLQIAGVFDSNQKEILTRLSASPIKPKIYSGLEEILPISDADIVVISTTTPSKIFLLKHLLSVGFDRVILEKPVCSSKSELDYLESLLEFGQIGVCHTYRYLTQTRYILHKIESGVFGRLLSVSVDAPNFGLATNGSHFLEYFSYLCKSELEVLSSQIDVDQEPNSRGPSYTDLTGVLETQSTSGTKFRINCDQYSGHGIFSTYSFEYGKIFIDELSGASFFTRRLTNQQDRPKSIYGMSGQGAFLRFPIKSTDDLIREFYRNYLKKENYSKLIDGWRAMKLIFEAVKANPDVEKTLSKRNSSRWP